MDVELYVYDLSKGLARMYSLPLMGTQIDAIYHTSLVLNGMEYFFGQGIQTATPGNTHHGQPMEKLHLGQTELPSDVIEEYISSLGEIYTPESYDLFLHNCNNFTQDLAMFLVGTGIPEHIRNLPKTFLETPLGQMLRPQIEKSLSGVTQASAPSSARNWPAPAVPFHGKVRVVNNLPQLEEQLACASHSCAVIFFTSATCPPCRIVYPVYDQLAEEASNKAVLIKVDVSTARDVGMKYSVRATPTFITFLKGSKIEQWSGADPARLRGNVRLLVQMAHPSHHHRQLHLPSLQRPITNFVAYKKSPPLEKLIQKLHPHHEDPRLLSIIDFINCRNASPADTPLPDSLPSFSTYLQTTAEALPRENLFALVDLARLLFLDPRVAGYFAEEPDHKTILTLLSPSEALSSCPYTLRIIMLQFTCNLFLSPLYPDLLVTSSSFKLHETCLRLATSCLLDSHTNLRVVAASLAYNIAAHNHNARFSETPDKLSEEDQVELTASLVEAITQEEESQEALHGLLFALGLIVYEAPDEGSVVDLCKAMGIADTITDKKKIGSLAKESLIKEVGAELLRKGL
ncbi:hypothetical protein EYZ11_005698 [Aspergillus tanneri]|uniref:Thioredoxin domain-containing protein n=1 Tax=Aspergillus tanneri TaxID=1220188 RepID=A0A4S3JHB1_9EURO|nr:uncharacterized protein ATNIH1004_001631 [Aspergillus tanneri]KAA8652726.1 hypothetical protein ATNIH1004_001631 [Aspergillus tanneri]THC94826.1 hypothetical protein EYZ11_005698 [Aspergillus tanneri]